MDRELASAFVALSARSIEKRTAPHFGPGRRNIDTAGLKRATRTMSTAETALVEVGIACWRGTGGIDMSKLTSLDQNNAKRVLTALAVRLGVLDYGTLTLDVDETLR